MSLNVVARVAISSFPRTRMRSERCPSASRDAILAAVRTGRTACSVTVQVMKSTRATSTPAPSASTFWIRPRVACSLASE